jgi:hypothetical protein
MWEEEVRIPNAFVYSKPTKIPQLMKNQPAAGNPFFATQVTRSMRRTTTNSINPMTKLSDSDLVTRFAKVQACNTKSNTNGTKSFPVSSPNSISSTSSHQKSVSRSGSLLRNLLVLLNFKLLQNVPPARGLDLGHCGIAHRGTVSSLLPSEHPRSSTLTMSQGKRG